MITIVIFFGMYEILNDLHSFFDTPNSEITLDMIEQILSKHNKDILAKKMRELSAIESGFRNFDEHLRDHVNHSMYVYLLGLFFDYSSKNLYIDRVLSWKLASLLHDIAHPLEMFSRAPHKWLDNLDVLISTITSDNRPGRETPLQDVYLNKYENLISGKNSIDLINDRVREWGLDLDVREYYFNALNSGYSDHGVLSAIFVLNVVDALYYKYNPHDEEGKVVDGLDWSYRYYQKHILDAVSAIAIHNIPLDSLNGKIRYETTPTAYMLKLCDTLQIWGRESSGRPILCPTSIKPTCTDREIIIELNTDVLEFNKIDLELSTLISSRISLQVIHRTDRLYH